MSLYSLVFKRVEDGGRTGVPRFDLTLRRAIPDLLSVTKLPGLQKDDLVITDNHLSLQVPADIGKVVVHHGCAQTHYERDPQWRTDHTREIVRMQRDMFSHYLYCDPRPPILVAPSEWVGERFRQDVAPDWITEMAVIPHWVEPIEPLPKHGKPRIIGDWRDHNKGAGIWKRLADRCPRWEFQPLNFQDETGRRRQYGEASLYLCFSLSEGGAYAVCDAEAAHLPIVTTDVGNYREFSDCEVIHWQDRENLDLIIDAIRRKLNAGRQKPSFYAAYTFERWAAAWHEAVA